MKISYLPRVSVLFLLHSNLNPTLGAPGRRPRAHELSQDYSFEQYIVDFEKSYEPNTNEYATKKQNFQTNLEEILNHNKNVVYDLETGAKRTDLADGANGGAIGHTFHMGVNHLTDLSKDEMKSYFGYNKAMHPSYNPAVSSIRKNSGGGTVATSRRQLTTDSADGHEVALPFNVTDVSTLPPCVHYNKTTPVKDQGFCGSCWAFSSIAVLETLLGIQIGELDVLSTQELVSCVKNPNHCGGSGGCYGATMELAFDYIASNGVIKESAFPYTEYDTIACPLGGSENEPNFMLRHKKVKEDPEIVAKIEGYARISTNNYKELMNAVAKYGPVGVAAAASTWGLYEGGVFSPPDKDSPVAWDLNHGVALEGYGVDETTGEDYWLIRNSWGAKWGENGYIRLLRVDPETLDDPDGDCGYDTTPFDGINCQLNPDGTDVIPEKMKVCGTSGVLYDAVLPVGGYRV